MAFLSGWKEGGGEEIFHWQYGEIKEKEDTERKRSHKYINAPLSQKESSASSLQTPPPPPTRDSPAGRNFRLSFFFQGGKEGGGEEKWEG